VLVKISFFLLLLLRSTISSADTIDSDFLDNELPPPHTGTSMEYRTGVWLLKIEDVANYETVSGSDYTVSKLEVKTTAWVYALLKGALIGFEDNTFIYDFINHRPFSFYFDEDLKDGDAADIEITDSGYRLKNYYKESSTDKQIVTGELVVSFSDDGRLLGYGEYGFHPKGLVKRFDGENLLGHKRKITGVKLSDTASFDDNLDITLNGSQYLLSPVGIKRVERLLDDRTSTTAVELIWNQSGLDSFFQLPRFDGYDFSFSILTSDDEVVDYSLTFNEN